MNYDHLKSTTTSAPEPQSSLMNDGNRVLDELSTIHQRLTKIAETLHGAAPLPVENEPKDVPVPNMRRNMDKALMWIDRIQQLISRIDSRI